MTTDDIDFLAGTDRQGLVAKTLRSELATVPALRNWTGRTYMNIAQAVLKAIDKDPAERPPAAGTTEITHQWAGQILTTPTADQQIRQAAVRIAQDRLGQAHTGGHGAPDPADTLLKLAERVAAYISDGRVDS